MLKKDRDALIRDTKRIAPTAKTHSASRAAWALIKETLHPGPEHGRHVTELQKKALELLSVPDSEDPFLYASSLLAEQASKMRKLLREAALRRDLNKMAQAILVGMDLQNQAAAAYALLTEIANDNDAMENHSVDALAVAATCLITAIEESHDHDVSTYATNRAVSGHHAHRKSKLRGFAIWNSRAWNPQADAEREIAKQCHITQAVAGRWIREFKRSPDTYRAAQSKHPAPHHP